MRSLYLIRYQMKGGLLCMHPFYSANLAETVRKFHAFMASQGCERDKYRLTSHREIEEPAVKLLSVEAHRTYLDRLSPDEQLQFFTDRKARQIATGDLITETTTRHLSCFENKEYA